MSHYIDQALAQIEKFEGRVPWMYLDTKSKVTVGIGCMLPTVAPALLLPFYNGDVPATSAEITKEFCRITAMQPGMGQNA